jgi:hypothetical protein
MAQFVSWYVEVSFFCKVCFADQECIYVVLFKKDCYFFFVVLQTICVPLGYSEEFGCFNCSC